MTPQRRRLFLNLRKSIRVHTRHKVEYAGGGKEKLTCTECGFIEVRRNVPEGTPDRMAEKLAKYRGDAAGVHGECKQCTKQRRDEQYPLTEKRSETTHGGG